MTIQAVSFRGEDQQKKSNVVPGAIIGAAAGAGTGYFAKQEISPDKFLEKYTKATDEFKLSEDAVKKVKAEDKDKVDKAVANINTAVKEHKDFDKKVTADFESHAGKDAKEVDAEKVAKYKGYSSVADIEAQRKAAEGETEALGKAVETAQNEEKALAKDATEEVKTAAKEKITTAQGKVTANADAIKGHKEAEALFKDKKSFTADEFTNIIKEKLKGNTVNTIEENFKPLKGLLEKVTSMKKVAIFGAIGLVAGAIIGKMMSPKAAPAEEAKA